MPSEFIHTPLGQNSAVPTHYAPELLAAVPRAVGRSGLGAASFTGVDVWQLYEISWRDPRGVPCIGAGRLIVPCESPSVVESKSLKLYLMGLNEQVFASRQACETRIKADVSACVGIGVSFVWDVLPTGAEANTSVCLEDELGEASLPVQRVEQARAGLKTLTHRAAHAQRLHTHVFRSLCPVTGQPDWASLFFRYEGAPIDPRRLLAYLVSFRAHGAMHEQCIEQIFADVMMACRPQKLCVDGRFLRRGGIDINPLRTNAWHAPLAGRLARQ